MQETSRHAVGIDIGTTTVRCVVAHIDGMTGVPTIVGVGTAQNSGMRKGTVVNLEGPAKAIDDALGEAERMSGYQIDSATISINGSHILSTNADGMIAVGGANHEINDDDLARIEEVATMGKVPANRAILEVIPHQYKLDGQDGIKNPIGMTGTRLEIDAHVISALTPHLQNLQKTCEMAKLFSSSIIVAGVAASRAVLTEQQIENGVVLIDMGGSTTNIAIYEEGDLQYVSVIPIGSNNITNDLAIGLKISPEMAENLKIEHASAVPRNDASGVSLKFNDEIFNFEADQIDEIVEARLEELFEYINKAIKMSGRFGKLPSGAVLTGGGSKLKGINEFAKEALNLAVTTGVASGYGGVVDDINQPQYATAIGLMLIDSEVNRKNKQPIAKNASAKNTISGGLGMISKLFNKFKS